MVEKKTEQKIVLSAPEGEKITQVKIADDGKSVEFIIASELLQEQQPAVINIEDFDKVFPITDPNGLIGHKLLEYEPTLPNTFQFELMNLILRGIKLKLPAFRSPCMDPSEVNGKIVFEPGNRPAVGHSSVWWAETWKNFMPSKNSRMGNQLQYAAVLGKLMKYLVEEKSYSVKEAWYAVCNDSCKLGHYKNSWDHKYELERTGCRKVGEYFDLANTYKIILWSGFNLVGGSCYESSFRNPLGKVFGCINDRYYEYSDAVGWLVLDV